MKTKQMVEAQLEILMRTKWNLDNGNGIAGDINSKIAWGNVNQMQIDLVKWILDMEAV